MKIDLRSDTVTRPVQGMLEAMMNAEVGDDVFEEDPSINQLEQKAADYFGMEKGLFCPSGTMTNQIGIKVHTNAPGEIICDESAHVYNYEGGGIGFNSGLSVKLVSGKRGVISPEDVRSGINPDDVHKPPTQLVAIENTCNRGGGNYYTLDQVKAISEVCKENALPLHLDGARVFNAIVETEENPVDYGRYFDSISICLSKGLGCPVGSVLIGDAAFIKKARRIRKIFGGGMRQAGYLAAAGIYALDYHIDRLKEDHRRAKELEDILSGLPFVKQVIPVETNIVVFELQQEYELGEFLKKLEKRGIKAVPFGKQLVRMVTHHDINDEMLQVLQGELKQL